MANIIKSIFGSRNDRMLRQYGKTVKKINQLENDYEQLSDEQIKAQTQALKERLQSGATLAEIIPDAFATVREASKRTLGMRHYDVQMIGGMVINDGKIAEMRTGEGKTLMSTLPAYLNALTEKGVHIVTVNDYLAQRDADWMRPVFDFLGITVGSIFSGQPTPDKQAAYQADITYGTNNEFGFDYLRNNLAFSAADRLQRGLNFAIIDEVDSILIDEARTPLIISGPADNTTDLYEKINRLVPQLVRQEEEDGPGDYSADEKSKQVNLTEEGHARVEDMMYRAGLIGENDSLYSSANIILMHHLNAAMRAHVMYQKDVDYIVQDGEIVIVDEFTGRTMPGRRWSDGLHQAIEAKESLSIQSENQTLASITFQNYFRMYGKLSGMTGTADTEAFEFQQIYGLEVAVIPTHKPMVRKDRADLVFRTMQEKFESIAEAIKEDNARGRPVLVGTTSIETSELLSNLLKKHNVKHNVLNAKQHEREAEIVANAGQLGAVTIATNMAGRGTDIALGTFDYAELVRHWQDKGFAPKTMNATGDIESVMVPHLMQQYFDTQTQQKYQGKSTAEQLKLINKYWKEHSIEPLSLEPINSIVELGGLHILGTERHESRRIDNQLRGRAGRQGDPGSSRFYISLEDNLMRIFGDVRRMDSIMGRLLSEGEAIESKMLSKQIEGAQRKVEGHNFDIRKNLLEYDDVANDQRKVIYEQRNELMDTDDISEVIVDMREDVVADIVYDYMPQQAMESQWNISGLEDAFKREFAIEMDIQQWLDADKKLDSDGVVDRALELLVAEYNEKEEHIGAPTLRHFEKAIMLQQLDMHWKEHLAAMDYLRQSVRFVGNAQKKPEHEYKREGFIMFNEMMQNIKNDTVGIVSRVRVRSEEEVEAIERQRQAEARAQGRQFNHAEAATFGESGGASDVPQAEPVETFRREEAKVGRNSPCPCGSGKKFKQCHGKLT